MTDPVLDFSEILGMYKADARRSVQQMQTAAQRWEEIAAGGPACQEIRKLAHQLRGSGRTYGFSNVTRIGKALEALMIKLQSKRLRHSERLRHVITTDIDRLAGIFKS